MSFVFVKEIVRQDLHIHSNLRVKKTVYCNTAVVVNACILCFYYVSIVIPILALYGLIERACRKSFPHNLRRNLRPYKL